MEVLNKLPAQLRDLFLSMTPGARITVGLLLVVVATSLALLLQQGSAVPEEYLFGSETFNGKQMAAVQAAIAKVGNDYRIEGNRVLVPRNKRDIYIAAVAEADALPRDIGSIMTEALDGGSLLESREAKKFRTQAAQETRLSRLIGLMPWVDEAFVILSVEDARGLNRPQQASAAVSVLPLPGETLDRRRLDILKKLVAASHPSLSVESVVIANLGDDSHANSGESPHDLEYEMHRFRASIQHAKREEIAKLLSYIPGVQVEVSATFGETVHENVRDSKPLKSNLHRRSTGNIKKTTRITRNGEEHINLEATGPNRRGPGARFAAGQHAENIPGNADEVNTIGDASSERTKGEYEVKEMHASVVVPREYIVSVWQQLNTPAEEPREPTDAELQHVQSAEINRIEELVKPLLPRLGAGGADFAQVHVEVVNSHVREQAPEPSIASNPLAWTGRNWGALTMFGLAVFSLVLLRSFVRSDSKNDRIQGRAAPALHLKTIEETSVESADSEDEPPRQRLKLQSSHSVNEDLAKVVYDDPDAVATILRNWINSVS